MLYGAFNAEECAKIIDILESQEFHKGSVGRGTVDEGVRDSDVVFVDFNPETHWIFERMQATMGRVNFDKFGLDLDGLETIQYTKYDEHGHYDWHIDNHQGEVRPVHRKLSMSVILANAEEGGDLMVNNNGNQDKATRIRTQEGEVIPVGTAIVFYSHLPHRVDPVVKGTRVSLVAWAVGPKLR